MQQYTMDLNIINIDLEGSGAMPTYIPLLPDSQLRFYEFGS